MPPFTSTAIQLLESTPATAGVELLEATPAAVGPELLEPAPAAAGIGTCMRVAVVDRRSMKLASTSCARMIWQGLVTATSVAM